MHHRLRNYFGRTRWYSLVKRLMWNLGSVCLEIVLILMQDRCTVCMEHTICSEINLDSPNGTVDAPDVLLAEESQVDARFGLFGDSANLDAR
jgi:hypothetical protein